VVERVPRDSEPDPIEVFVKSDRLLRKDSPRFREDEEAFKREAREFVVDVLDREPFDCDVAVYVDIKTPESRQQQPLMPPVVKAYLDALEGIAYREDRQIAHLVVHRHDLDHPWLSGLKPGEVPRTGSVFISVQALTTYTRLYDTAFRRGIYKRVSPWWRERTFADDRRLGRLRGQRIGMALTGQDTAAIDPEIALLDERRLTDTPLADLDRPGPLPAAMRMAQQILPTHRMIGAVRRHTHGSTFLLELRGQGRGTSKPWKQGLREELERHSRRRFMARRRLESFVALDIAVRGLSIDGKDLDNLAHSILGPFEEKFCVRQGTVRCYRVYTAVGKPQGVQVRILDEPRMLDLERELTEARDDRS
jgi:hypothetical protein